MPQLYYLGHDYTGHNNIASMARVTHCRTGLAAMCSVRNGAMIQCLDQVRSIAKYMNLMQHYYSELFKEVVTV